jgi:hypothetical protein
MARFGKELAFKIYAIIFFFPLKLFGGIPIRYT